MYLVVFFLLLWTLFQCILCENCTIKNPDVEKLYVLSSPGGNNDNLRDTFYEFFYTFEIPIEILVLETTCSDQLLDALRLTKDLRYVIYYGITDFYKNNYNDVRNSNMERVGDYGRNKTTLVCKSDKRNASKYIRELHGPANETCSSFYATEIKFTMLTSRDITSFPYYTKLLDVIYRFKKLHNNELLQIDDEPFRKNNFIIISCKDYFRDDNYKYIGTIFEDKFKTIEVRQFSLDTCKNGSLPGISYWTNVTAIVAPGPEYVEKLHSYADKPIIFYDEITNRTMNNKYENAIIRKMELKDEIAVLWNLISYGWKRVAIISDGSAPNIAFEKEVRTLFEVKEVSYAVKSVECQNKVCDFNEALSALKSVDARIIIANVDEQYADSLVKQARKKGMTKAQNIWIARAWSEATCVRASKHLETILTVTMEPKPFDAIEVIKSLFKEGYEYRGFLTEAKFAEDIRKKYILYQGKFLVKRIGSSLRNFLSNMPSDRGECMLRSDNFDKPCDDMVGIMVALVIVVLAVTVLGITYFFDEPYTPYNRMAH